MKLAALSLSQSFRNATTLITGTVISQVIPLLAAPILTRIYLPEHYGIVGIFIAVTTLIGIVGTLQYSTAIVLPQDDETALDLVRGCILVLCIVSSLTLLLIALVYFVISRELVETTLGHWIWLVPVSVFLIGINLAFTNLANRHKLFKILSRNRVFSSLASAITSIVIGGFIYKGVTGLIAGYIVGQVIASIVLVSSVTSKINGSPFVDYEIPKIKAVLAKYINFPKYSLVTEFINSLINQLPIFTLGKFVGSASVGLYNMSNRMLGLPIFVITSAISEVFKQKATEDFHKTGNCTQVFLKTAKTLLLLSVVPFAILILYGADIFAIVFGEKWRSAGVYAQIMGIMFFFRFIISPLTFVYYIRGKQQEDFLLHLVMLAMGFFSFYVGYLLFHDTKEMLLIYSLGYSLIYIVYFVRSFQLSKGHE